MKTFSLLLPAACFALSACSDMSHDHHSSSGSASRATTYGEGTEETHERYGGREMGPHPGAAGYDPAMDRSTR